MVSAEVKLVVNKLSDLVSCSGNCAANITSSLTSPVTDCVCCSANGISYTVKETADTTTGLLCSLADSVAYVLSSITNPVTHTVSSTRNSATDITCGFANSLYRSRIGDVVSSTICPSANGICSISDTAKQTIVCLSLSCICAIFEPLNGLRGGCQISCHITISLSRFSVSISSNILIDKIANSPYRSRIGNILSSLTYGIRCISDTSEESAIGSFLSSLRGILPFLGVMIVSKIFGNLLIALSCSAISITSNILVNKPTNSLHRRRIGNILSLSSNPLTSGICSATDSITCVPCLGSDPVAGSSCSSSQRTVGTVLRFIRTITPVIFVELAISLIGIPAELLSISSILIASNVQTLIDILSLLTSPF